MSRKKWILVACLAAFLCLWQNAAFAGHDHGHGDEDHGRGHGHAYGHEKHAADEHHGHYRDHDRELHEWYREHQSHLPPGLAKRDALPAGLERQIVVRATLPPGLRGRMHPCPVDVERYLPPPPVGYVHTVIGGNIALVNRKTFLVLDIYKF
jgi:Ni/Co efflux regulator RcnB